MKSEVAAPVHESVGAAFHFGLLSIAFRSDVFLLLPRLKAEFNRTSMERCDGRQDLGQTVCRPITGPRDGDARLDTLDA